MCSLFLTCGHQAQQSPSISWSPSAGVRLLWRACVCGVCVHYSCSKSVFAEEYEKNYIEVSQLGEGGFGTVYCGYRRDDLFPVAIKHIDKDLVKYQPVVINGEQRCVPMEMVLMTMAARDSVGENAVVSPLAWTDLDYEVLLIMERPENCMNLFDYNNGQIDEAWLRAQSDNIFGCSLTLLSVHQEFMRQLVEAAIQIHKAGEFHGDLKPENILIQFYDAWRIPRVRVIDFGCGWFVTPGYRGYSDCKTFLKSCLLVNPDQRLTLGQMWCHPWFH
ncbi:hypothetical protein D4764_19G0002090 [Takifugu flavidus]|uniref:non-specific serine/threonine protein kinase n=1 Tax=Takifugu flavidus TaxID=433684 RepID=A0A5C6NP33_9TELE|nr:hypothetical protein D4764_19G0002090 [Takifugu flavidus]